jgi:hypothetical protein
VVVSSYEIIPTIAYYYNRTYFSKIADGKQYYLTDSLLRADNVYCTYNPAEIERVLSAKFTKVIYLAIDEKSNTPNYPIISLLNNKYSLVKQDQLNGSGWCLSFYASHRQ